VKIYFSLKIALYGIHNLYSLPCQSDRSCDSEPASATALLTLDQGRSMHPCPACHQHSFIWALPCTGSTHL